jgi:predicted DCC family thiol-disulfide oxidoreductase YuxK
VNERPLVYPLVIYYDASCPLCAEEMHTLKGFDALGRLQLVDCSTAGFTDAETGQAGIAQPTLMRRIHARDAAGRWMDGIAVFEAAYAAAGINAVALLWGNRRWRSLLDRCYMWVARNRMRLSRIGINKVYGLFVRLAARNAERRSRACSAAGGCAVPASKD